MKTARGNEFNKMTLQIGIVGTDGIVLASDTKETQLEGTPGSEGRSFSMTSKFVERNGFVCCYSGDNKSRLVAENISNQKWDAIKKDVSGSLGGVARLEKIPCDGTIRKVLVCCPNFSLWQVDIQLGGHDGLQNSSFANPKLDKVIAGDANNMARYWANCHLVNTVAAPINFPVEKLLFIAAHTILMAAVENSTGVGGLEMRVIYKDGRRRYLTSNGIQYLMDRSEELTRMINGHLFSSVEIGLEDCL